MKGKNMFHRAFPHKAFCLMLSAVMLSALPGCSKRIDTSSQEKFYKSWTEVMDSLPASKQKEFDDGMTTIWFYSENDAETNAMIHGKTGKEMLALIEEMKASLPKLDTTSKDAFESSKAKIRAGLPSSKIKDFDAWEKELPPYRQGNPRIDSLNGLTFQKIVENRDFSNGQNPGFQKK